MKALVKTAEQNGYDLQVLKAVEAVNESQKRWALRKIEAQFGSDLSGRTFGVWGLAFKPNTDDMREAPAIVVVNGLLERGAQVRVTDPVALHEARRHFGDRVTYCEQAYEAVDGADALVVCTEWNQFRNPDFDRLRSLLKEPVVIDGRNIYSDSHLPEKGFTYVGVGRPNP